MPHTHTPTPTLKPSLKLVVISLIVLLLMTLRTAAADSHLAFDGAVISSNLGSTPTARRAKLPADAFSVTGYRADHLGPTAVLLTESSAAEQAIEPRAATGKQPKIATRNVCKTAKLRRTLKNLAAHTHAAWHCSLNYAYSASVTPNDTYYSLQYGAGLMSLPAAWDITTGSSNTVAVVIDTGIDYNHPDIAPNMWTNPAEIAGNGIDDDKNGYIDDVYGINAITNSGNPFDDNGHGTHVSGIIGARGNNGSGVAGASWNVKLVGAKFLSSSGSGSLSDAIKAINYANNLKRAGHRVVVTNNSWGGGGFSTALYNAIRDSENLGIMFVAAAGNATNNNDTNPSYPASYSNNNVISVASVTSTGALSSFSNYGATSVDIAAPGSSIASTYPNNQYAYMSGTSMASPQVTGVVALLQSACGGNLSVSQMRSALLTTGTQYPGLSGKVASGAIVNAFGAVQAAQSSCALSTPTPDPLPTTEPTPTATPTSTPTVTTTATPPTTPTSAPTGEPTAQPTSQPTSQPTTEPTSPPVQPTATATSTPTMTPTAAPTQPPATPAPTLTSTPLPTITPTSTPTVAPLALVVTPNTELRYGSRFSVAVANVGAVPAQPVSLLLTDSLGGNYTCGSLVFPVAGTSASASFIFPITGRYFTAFTFAAQSGARSAQASLSVWRPYTVNSRAFMRQMASATCLLMKRSVRRALARANR